MICPKCNAEYLDYIKDCSDCKISLIDSSKIDLQNSDLKWTALPDIQGKIYADMITDILNQKSIPNYARMDWVFSAYLVDGANLPGQKIKIFVPKKKLKQALSITTSILGIHK